MRFRYIAGISCFLFAAVFLGCNSIILYRGAQRSAHEDIDKQVFGIVAAVVPWVIAILPALIQDTWVRTFLGARRPSLATVAVSMIWVVFIAYNLSTGAGVIATSRQETVADREHGLQDVVMKREQRERLKSNLSGIPQHRPTGAIEGEIRAARIPLAFANSKQCTEPATRDQRDLCTRISKLQAELEAAKAADQVQNEITAIEQDLAMHGPIVINADPQADLIHDATGFERAKIQLWLPAATPIVLEFGAALLLTFGLNTLGIRLHPIHAGHHDFDSGSGSPVQFNPAPLMSPERAKRTAVSLETLTAQRKLAVWFFTNCTRPVAGGAMLENEWYEHYVGICRKSRDEPLPMETFRRIAMLYVPRIGDIDGRTHYFEVLPLIPEGAS